MAGLNNLMIKKMYEDNKMSIPEISKKTGVPRSTVRYRLEISGTKFRPRCEAQKMWFDKSAAGKFINRGGYVEFSRRLYHRGKLEHDVIMEKAIGRPMEKWEVVHHKNRDRSDNRLCNLLLMSKSDHTKLHRREDGPRKISTNRNKYGQFTKQEGK